MLSHVIKTSTECNVRRLSYYISSFLKRAEFSSRYNSIQLKFYTVNNDIIPIGDSYLLDIQNKLELKTYRFYIIQNFIHDYPNKEKVNKIVFNYINRSRKEYLSHIKSIKKQL